MKQVKIILNYVFALFIVMTNLSFINQPSPNKGNIKVVVTNFRNANGQIGFFLFNSDIGVSNNAKGHFGPPKFEDAKFVLNKSEQTVRISLKYL